MGFRYRLVALLLAAALLARSPRSQVSANTYLLFRMRVPFAVLNWGMNTWGYINTTGAWVIQPQFESPFRRTGLRDGQPDSARLVCSHPT